MKTKKPSKCPFDKKDGCHALACYSREKCGSRDENGWPVYVSLPAKKEKTEMSKRTKVRILKRAEVKSRLAVVPCEKDRGNYFHLAQQIFNKKTRRWQTIITHDRVFYSSPEQAVRSASVEVGNKMACLVDIVQIIPKE